MRGWIAALLLLAASAQAQDVARRVADDAIALDRVAQAAKRDLPVDLLRRIVDEDVDLLRGKRTDGTYQYATFERFDSGRFSESFSVQYRKNKMETLEVKGTYVYRLVVEVPSRRMLVRKNRPVWIESVDLELLSERGSQTERQSIDIKQWLKPGEFRPIDLPVIARQATVRVVASVEEKAGYGNVDLALIKAKIVDNADSPYADAVASAKAIQRALDNGDTASIRAMAQRMRGSLEQSPRQPEALSAPSGSSVTVVAPPPAAAPADRETQRELQAIEDLLTGTDAERREGMDRLHQLLRRLRQ